MDKEEKTQPVHELNLLERLHRSLGPLAGGLILDFVDLATFGPLGLFLGPIVGALVGWWISSIYRYKTSSRIVWAILAAIYCTIPLTEIIPVATIISALARFSEKTAPDDLD